MIRFPSERGATMRCGPVAYRELAIRFWARKYKKGNLNLNQDVRGEGLQKTHLGVFCMAITRPQIL